MHARLWLFAGLLILGSLSPVRAQQPWAMPPTGGQYAAPSGYWPAGPGARRMRMPGNYGYQTAGSCSKAMHGAARLWHGPAGLRGQGYPPIPAARFNWCKPTVSDGVDECQCGAGGAVTDGTDDGGGLCRPRRANLLRTATSNLPSRASAMRRSLAGNRLRPALASVICCLVRTRHWGSGRLRPGPVWRQAGFAPRTPVRQGRCLDAAPHEPGRLAGPRPGKHERLQPALRRATLW